MVVLAMLQIVLPALEAPMRASTARRDLVYTSVRSAFAQAQASVCTSVGLVQAGVLIALHEYVCVRPESAYISMMTWAGLAQILGIGLKSVSGTRVGERLSDSFVEEKEMGNIVWAIAMVERYNTH